MGWFFLEPEEYINHYLQSGRQGRKTGQSYLQNVKRGANPVCPITVSKITPMFNPPKNRGAHVIRDDRGSNPPPIEN